MIVRPLLLRALDKRQQRANTASRRRTTTSDHRLQGTKLAPRYSGEKRFRLEAYRAVAGPVKDTWGCRSGQAVHARPHRAGRRACSHAGGSGAWRSILAHHASICGSTFRWARKYRGLSASPLANIFSHPGVEGCRIQRPGIVHPRRSLAIAPNNARRRAPGSRSGRQLIATGPLELPKSHALSIPAWSRIVQHVGHRTIGMNFVPRRSERPTPRQSKRGPVCLRQPFKNRTDRGVLQPISSGK